jgi:hypothetical protein
MSYTIVLGTGISATAWLASLRERGDITVVGGKHLWQKMEPQHRMGQPEPLLTGNLLPGRRDFHQNDAGTFMLARDFAEIVDATLRRYSSIRIPSSIVTAILPARGGYEVKVNIQGIPSSLFATNVVVALGAGPARALTAFSANGEVDVDVAAMNGRVVAGTDFLSPDWRMPGGGPAEGRTVAAYGGSATAAWVVEQAGVRAMQVVAWFTRPGRGDKAWDVGARFQEAFPAGGRNQQVKVDSENIRSVLKLTKVELVGEKLFLVAQGEQGEQGEAWMLTVDLLVYALGADHLGVDGIREMLEPGLRKRLVAFYDRNHAISAGKSLLAIGTEDRSLMIVGSAMSSRAGFGGKGADLAVQSDPGAKMSDLGTYADISKTLPLAARPTEGIAMVMAGLEALNEYMPVRVHRDNYAWDINFNTSNRTQLAAWVADTTDLEPFAANLAVALIIHLRSSLGTPYGLTRVQVQTVLGIAGAVVKRTRHTIPKWDDWRLKIDQIGMTDKYIAEFVNKITADPVWVRRLAGHGHSKL